MPKVLQTIFKTRLDITALAAVVDGLPSRKQELIGKHSPAIEGFAFLHCDQEIVLPQLWAYSNSNRAPGQSHSQRPSLIFKTGPGSSLEGVLEIGMPLANTMFRNGRKSTLLASRWRKTNASDEFEKIQQMEKKSVTINLASSNRIIPLHLEIPLVSLTPPRRVVSGLGNIIRQVMDVKGTIVSASKELESSVDSYFKARSFPTQAVTIWAFIIPDFVMLDRKNKDILSVDLEEIHASWIDVAYPSMSLHLGNWLQQGRGATLHRVRKC